jgi:hypothetical protein
MWQPPKHKSVRAIAPSIHQLVQQLAAEDSDRYLYRGQNGVYGPDGDVTRQVPSAFRACTTLHDCDGALMLSHLRTAWVLNHFRKIFQLKEEDRPRHWADMAMCALNLGDLERPASVPAILGIAQHYGIPTENLDLTSLEPAAVFATQRWLSLDQAIRFPRGASLRLDPDAELGFIYRYDIVSLLKCGLTVGDLSTGNAGARPIQQEGRVLTLAYDQDKAILEEGAYEIFPFKQTGRPFSYNREIRPSRLLNEDQKQAIQTVSAYLLRDRGFAIRDMAVPSFYFREPFHHPGTWTVYFGARPDPFLAFGQLCEDVLPKIRDFSDLTEYAKLLFGELLGKSTQGHPSRRDFLRCERQRLGLDAD